MGGTWARGPQKNEAWHEGVTEVLREIPLGGKEARLGSLGCAQFKYHYQGRVFR